MPNSINLKTGYLFALGSSIVVGLMPILSKVLVGKMDPLVASAFTFMLAGAILVPLNRNKIPDRDSLKWITMSALLGAVLAPSVYFFGINKTSAVSAALISNTEVFFTVLIAYIVLRERLKLVQILESTLVFSGIVLVTTELNFSSVSLSKGLFGNILILLASIAWAMDNNLSRITSQRFGPVFVSTFRNLIGGFITFLLTILGSSSLAISVNAFPWLFALSVDIALATLSFMAALARIGATRTLLVFSTSSVLGAIYAVGLLGEKISGVQIVGLTITLLGIYLIWKSD